MKFRFLIILFILSSCRTHNSGLKSDLSDSLKKPNNPTLLAIQFLTVKIKGEKGKWPENPTDYIQTFNDSVTLILLEFKEIDFKQSNDTLQIQYTLIDTERVKNYDIEFVDSHLYTDSATIKFENEVKKIKTGKIFKSNEGRMTFYESSDHFSVIHEYEGGTSKNKITTAQP